MPGFKEHWKAGATTGLVLNLALQLRDAHLEQDRPLAERLGELATAYFLGGVGGIAPDLIEPATTPNHRAFFHGGVTVIGNIAAIGHTLAERTPRGRIACSAASGYLSHLVLDSGTKKSLPLIA